MSPGRRGGGFSLPIVQAQPLKERAQPATTGLGVPSSPGEERGTGSAVSGWGLGGLLAGAFPGVGSWLQSLGLPPLLPASFEELADTQPSPAAHSWAEESGPLYTSRAPAQWTLPPQNFALWLQPTTEVCPQTFLSKRCICHPSLWGLWRAGAHFSFL